MAEPAGPEGNGVDATASPVTDNGASFQVPERFQGKSAEDIARSYAELEQMHGRQMQELQPYLDAQKKYEQYGGIEGLEQSYGQLWNTLQSYMQNAGQPQQPQQAQQPIQNYAQDANAMPQQGWDQDWDMLTPREQAQRMMEMVRQDAVQNAQQLVQQLYQQGINQFDQRFGTLERQFDIYKSVLETQRQYPDIDTNQMLQQALEISKATPQQLLELATKSVLNSDEKRQEAAAKELFEQWKADEMLRQQNERQAALLNRGGQTLRSQLPQSQEGNNDPFDPDQTRAAIIDRLTKDPDSGLNLEHFI